MRPHVEKGDVMVWNPSLVKYPEMVNLSTLRNSIEIKIKWSKKRT